jgi:hypothetical protein
MGTFTTPGGAVWDDGPSLNKGTTGVSSPSPLTINTPAPPTTFNAAGGSSSSGGGGGVGSGALNSLGEAYNSSGTTGGGGSSGGGGGDGGWLGALEGIINTVVNIFGVSQQAQAQQFGQNIATTQLAMSKEAQKFGQNLQTQNLALNKAQTASGLQTAGLNRYQAGVAFQESQQDRAKHQKTMNALASGIATGLAQRPQTAAGGFGGQQQQPATLTNPTV